MLFDKNGPKRCNVCHAVNHHVIYYFEVLSICLYILSEYHGFVNIMCRFDEIRHVCHLVSCCVLVASRRACVLDCLADLPLPVGAARQRVGRDHQSNQFALRVAFLFVARTCHRALPVSTLAQEQWLYQVYRTRLLWCTRDTYICMNRVRVEICNTVYRLLEQFSNDAIVRVTNA